MKHALIALAALGLPLLTGCNGGGSSASGNVGPAATQLGSLSGQVFQSNGIALEGAEVLAQDPMGTSLGSVFTDNVGRFSLQLAAGAVDLSIEVASMPVYQAVVLVTPENDTDLGNISIVGNATDSDGDGLSDELEEAGWSIFVDLDGMDQLTMRHVSSDPNSPDTDADGLDDSQELAARLDPRAYDTDFDLLGDFEEIYLYKSNPSDVDTDGDARGPLGAAQPNPSLFDGNELLLSGTSPTLADTDGDGLTDQEEILGGGFHPLVADLPTLSLELNGDPSLTLNATVTTTMQSASASATLERNESETIQSDTQATQVATEMTDALSGSASVSYPPEASATVEMSTEFKESFMNETSSSWSEQSVMETQMAFESSFGSSEDISFTDGEMQQALKLVNQSDRTFLLSDIRVLAFRLNPSTAGSFQIVGTLSPSANDIPAGGVLLAPGGEATFVAQNDSINWQAIKPLMEDPTSLVFQVGAYSLNETDAFGVATTNYAVLGQDVTERCGLLVIDFGDGRVDRYSVATNVQRNPDGSAAGVRLGDVLRDVLGIPFSTTMLQPANKEGLMSLGGLSAFQDPSDPSVRGYWALIGSTPEFALGSPTDFEDLCLNNGERISLVFLRDSDGDGLFDREERVRGSDPFSSDSDLEGLDDFTETKVGWTVDFFDLAGTLQPQFSYQVYSDARFVDGDQDTLDDATERALGTDPRNPDTDGDGLYDVVDPFPLDAPLAGGGNGTGLVGYYRLDNLSLLDSSPLLNHAFAGPSINGRPPIIGAPDRFGDPAGSMSTYFGGSAQEDVWIGTPPVNTGSNFSYAMWVNPSVLDAGYLIQTGGVSLRTDGSNFPDLYVNNSFAFKGPSALPLNTWSFVVVDVTIFGFVPRVKLYVDGVLVADQSLSVPLSPGNSGLVIANYGGEETDRVFKGSFDDARLYQRSLSTAEIQVLFHEGGF